MRGISLVDLIAVRSANADRWSHAKIARSGFDPVAWRPAAPTAKQRYLVVSARTGVPWLVIAVIHGRECSQNWAGALAQRDPRAKKSIHVPAGRGPFKSWKDAAVDALVNCAPYAERNKDWSIGSILTQLSCVGLLLAMAAIEASAFQVVISTTQQSSLRLSCTRCRAQCFF
jgi:lysozyme family protein